MDPKDHFGADVARRYDQDHANSDAVAETVEALRALSGGGRVLEFAIGTGRIALPLAAMGVPVAGIELSRAMVDELRRKETGAPIPVVIGDMTTAQVPGAFALVALVYNTIDNLTTQAAQVACFRNAAAHLEPGGRFVVETLVPPVQKLPFGETRSAFACEGGHIGVDVIDIATQLYSSTHVWLDGNDSRALTVPFRYAWPAEMDLMAQMAGMALEHRWADWTRAPFDRFSRSHVSVWRKG
ncbi:MAG: class I SAM-dependent methyltransferase [Roseivivax sp.]|nr:class I SAM-dependent methyltransferase [Roseivivax sp.]